MTLEVYPERRSREEGLGKDWLRTTLEGRGNDARKLQEQGVSKIQCRGEAVLRRL